MTVVYPEWAYSATDPPTLVTGPAQLAALPAGFTPDPALLPDATALAAIVPLPIVKASVPPVGAPVLVKLVPVLKRDHDR